LIVCSCNVLSEEDVRSAVCAAGDLRRTARQVYGCLGCNAECGRCARTINKIIKDALGACAKQCADGCPHAAPNAELRVSAGRDVSAASAL
jgi:bacterioferritin-associated ferredoxin